MAAGIFTLLSTVLSVKAQRSAASDQRDIAQRNQRQREITDAETKRRRDAANKRKISTARARAAASGAGGSSLAAFLGELEAETGRQTQFAENIAGVSSANQFASDLSIAQQTSSQATASLIGGLGQAGASSASFFGGQTDFFGNPT